MSRILKDQFAKGTLSSLLAECGEVEISRELRSEVRQVDVSFVPDPDRSARLEPLGCLGRMAAKPCLIEPFSSPARQISIRIALMKQEMLWSEQTREARRQKRPLSAISRAQLWMLFSTCSKEIRALFGTQQRLAQWPEGFFFLPFGHAAAIIGIAQLPETRETLMLRLLGRGATQRRAVAELSKLSKLSQDDPLGEMVLRQIRTWVMILEGLSPRSARYEERVMNIQKYQEMAAEQERQILQRGIQQGMERGMERGLDLARDADRRLIETQMRLRYGRMDPELKGLIPALLDLPPEELGTVLLTLPRETLLERFCNPQ